MWNCRYSARNCQSHHDWPGIGNCKACRCQHELFRRFDTDLRQFSLSRSCTSFLLGFLFAKYRSPFMLPEYLGFWKQFDTLVRRKKQESRSGPLTFPIVGTSRGDLCSPRCRRALSVRAIATSFGGVPYKVLLPN